MDLSNILPPSDLLQKARDLESGLKQRKRLGTIGWFGFLLISAVQFSLALSHLEVISKVVKDPKVLLANWWLFALVVPAVFLLLLGTWSRFWLKESRQAFRYTCSISPFIPITVDKDHSHGVADECMTWLPHDITRLLKERVQRFVFAGDATPADGAAEKDKAQTDEEGRTAWDSYIHIRGYYVVRPRAALQSEFEIEVIPRVRIGPPNNPEVMAQSTVFPLAAMQRNAKQGTPATEPTDKKPLSDSTRDGLDRATYDDLLEQVYHAIVTEVYQQLKGDIQRKIDLLPTDRFRIIALLYEAADYARSNTIRAYKEAQELYLQAARLADPRWHEPPKTRLLRLLLKARCAVHRATVAVRTFTSRVYPGAAEINLRCSRALVGYARMLLFHHALSGLAGLAINPIYETRPIIERALEHISSLGLDVPGRVQALYEAQVTLSLAFNWLSDTVRARNWLENARATDPQRVEMDPIFIYASSLVSPSRRTQLSLLRKVVELSPRFEVAQFELASKFEDLWRSRDTFEESVAKLLLQEYRKLSQINPGNLGAWANCGYVCWLLESKDNIDKAVEYFKQGLRFKGLQREIFVAELDYGLARICAERGDVAGAYEHYISAASALLSRESDRGDFRDYYFRPLGPAMLGRFERYANSVEEKLAAEGHGQKATSTGLAHDKERRLRASVHAFVLNDLGEAYLASGDIDKAVKTLCRAIQLNPDFVLPYHNLGRVPEQSAPESRFHYLKRVVELQPRWPLGRIELASYYASAAQEARDENDSISSLTRKIKEVEAELAALEQQSSQPVTKLEDALATSAPRWALQLSFSPEREQRKAIVQKLTSELNNSRRNAEEKTKLAQRFRQDAESLAHSLLPHQWLWELGGLTVARLADPTLRAELRWEREFNDLHVLALYAWTLRFVHNEEEITQAVAFLDHIREHYWPADPTLFSWLLKLQKPGSSQDQIKKRAQAAFAASPGLVNLFRFRSLEEFGFDVQEQIELLNKAIEFAPEDPGTVGLRRRIADLYTDMASKKDGDEAANLYQRAAEAEPNSAERHSVLAAALEKAGGNRPGAAVEKALAEARKACDLDNNNSRYAAELQRLSSRSEALQRRAKLEKDVERRFGSQAKNLQIVEQPLLVEYSQDLDRIFAPEPGAEDEHRKAALKDLSDGLFWELGVRFPSPDFRPSQNPALKRSYDIQLWGIPMVRRELNRDRWLFDAPPEQLIAQTIPATPATNPATGKACSWVAAVDLDRARHYADKQQLRYWSPFDYVVFLDLPNVFRDNALDFLRVDEVLKLMSDRGLKAECEDLRRDGRLVELTNVLRALVADRFRVYYVDLLRKVFLKAYASGTSLTAAVEQVRSHPDVRKQSVYFQWGGRAPLVRVGPKFEAIIKDGLALGGGMVLALDPTMTQNLLATVRDFVNHATDIGPSFFLLCTNGVRPWVRKLVELEFPHLRVVSMPEVLPEGLAGVSRIMEYEDN